MVYTPPKEVLERYADVLINFGLGGGRGINPGDVVRIVGPEAAKPLYAELHRAVWRAGGHALGHYLTERRRDAQPDAGTSTRWPATSRSTSSPTSYMRGLVDQIDHQVSVHLRQRHARARGHRPRRGSCATAARSSRSSTGAREKENAGRFSWTLGLYGTPAMAAEAGLSEEEYWAQITRACFLDDERPDRALARGQRADHASTSSASTSCRSSACTSPARTSTCTSRSASAACGSAAAAATSRASRSSRARTGAAPRAGSPSTSRSTATATSSAAIRLEFADGRVVRASADENERVIAEMVATDDADRVGEFSLTDRRFSRITKFMAETLYDENVGGPFGNTHIALGKSYHDCYAGDPADRRRRRVGAPRLQRVDRPHRHRLDHRPHRHRDAARRQRARHLRGRRVPAVSPVGAAAGRSDPPRSKKGRAPSAARRSRDPRRPRPG